MNLVFSYLLAFAAATALVPLCRSAALRLGYVARPKADRWNQRQAALLGGVAIAAVTLAGGWLGGETTPHLRVILLSGFAVFVLGLVDDLKSLKPSTKLVAEIAIASLFVYFGYRLHWSESLTVDAMLTLFWVVGMTNAFNLLDNMDGLCAGIGLIVAGALMVTSADADPARARYLAFLMGALSGFLIYNFNPASIFMGDSGSLFIGLTLSTLALEPAAGGRAGSGLVSVVGAPLLLLLIPIFDTTFVTVMRLLSGRKPSQGGRDHSSHRLVAIGLPERTAVMVLWTLAGLGGLIGLELHFSETGLGGAAAAAFVLAMGVFAVYLSHVKVYESSDAALRTGRITPFVSVLTYKRRAAEVMLDVCLVALSYYVAYRLRFEGPEFGTYFPQFMASMPIVVAIQMVTLFAFGMYRGAWRYFGLMDGVAIVKAVGAGTVAAVTAIVFLHRFENYSRGVFIIYGAMLLLFLVGSRASFRLMSEFVRRRRGGDRLVVYGAGDGGSLVIRELMNEEHHYRILGFIEDDPTKRHLRLQGYPVLGGYETLTGLAAEGAVDAVVVSTRNMTTEKLDQLSALCIANGVVLWRLHVSLEQIPAS